MSLHADVVLVISCVIPRSKISHRGCHIADSEASSVSIASLQCPWDPTFFRFECVAVRLD